MNKKGKFLAVLLTVFALSVAVFGVSCKKGDNSGDVQGETKTATYYTDAADGEYIVELYGNDCLLKIGSETMLGKFTLKSGAITFTTDKGTFEGTINGDEIDFTYGDKHYLMLEKIERTVRFSDGTEQKVLNGKTAVKPAADPAAPENKAFVGWYADEGCTKLYNFGTPVRSDISVYARMADNPVGGIVYTATAIYDDGRQEEFKTVGGKVYGLAELAEKDGKAFDGWYVSDFNSADKLTYKYNESIALTQNVNLYPVWKDGITGLSVNSEKVTWDSYAAGAQYTVKVSSKVSTGAEQTVSQTEFKISDYLEAAGEYVITVSVSGASKTVYYNNKALARPTVEIIDGTTVKYNAVANAEKYYVTVDCGNKDHRHEAFDNGTSTVYDISSCEMQKGGIKVYVEAKANGYVSATSDVCRFERNLDAVKGVAVNGSELVWNAVDKAISYIVVVDGKEYNAGSANSYSLKSFGEGEHTVGVYPVAKGYNSPEATGVAYVKTQLATPDGLTVSDGRIVWNAVEGATSYTVKIGDKAITVDTNSAEFKGEYLNGKSSIGVSVCAAKADGAASDYSDVCTVYYGALANVKYENGVLSWSPVSTANGYTVTVGGIKTVVKNGTSAKIAFNKSGENEIKLAYTMSVNGSDREITSTSVKVTAYEVRFYNADGTYQSVYAAYGDAVSAEADSVPGYHFSGWYDIPEGGKNNGSKFTSGVLGKIGNLSLYANLSPNKYTVTYDATYGEAAKASDDVYYNESFKLLVPTTQDENLVFDGWYTDVNGAGTRYTDRYGNSVRNYMFTDDTVLKANWKKLFNFTLNTQKDGYNVTGGDALDTFTQVKIPEKYQDLPVLSVDDLSTGIALEKVEIPRYAQIVTGDGEGVLSSAFRSCKKLASIEVYEPADDELKKLDAKFTSFDGVIYEILEIVSVPTENGSVNEIKSTKLSMVPLAKGGSMRVYEKTTEIAPYAFNRSVLEEIIVPASVETVGSNAFDTCSNLKRVVFENAEDAKPLTLGKTAFKSCGKLEEVTLPARLTASNYELVVDKKSTYLIKDVEYKMDFDLSIFTSCSSLNRVNVEGTYGKAAYTSIDGILYSADGKKLIYCPRGRTEAVTTNKAVTIGSAAFYGCNKIEKVEIGAPVTAIDEFAFAECSAVNDLTFKGTKDYNALTIKFGAFLNNKMLTEVTLPENLSSMDTCAFGGTALLKTVTLNSVGENGKVNFADGVFGSNSKNNPSYYVQTVTLGEKTPAFGIASVFGNKIISFTVSENNANYTKGEKDEYYGSYTDASGATRNMLVYVPSYYSGEFVVKAGTNEICANTFNGNVKIESVVIPASVDKIGAAAFNGASNLVKVTFEADKEGGATALEISNNAFYQCSNLSGNIVFPARLTSIGDKAFCNTKKVTGITFTGTKLTSIGESAFQWCKSITAVTLPEGLVSIGKSAFSGCEALDSFTISSTVTEIGDDMLSNAELLTTVQVNSGNKTFKVTGGILYKLNAQGAEAELVLCPMGNAGERDEATNNDHTVHIPNTVEKVAPYTFKYNAGIEQIIFDDNAEDSKRNLEIGEMAFYSRRDSKIKKIVLPEGMTAIDAKTFYSCYADEVVIPTSVTSIKALAFQFFYGKNVTFKEGGTAKLTIEDGKTTAGTGVFAGCNYLTEMIFPERTVKIGGGAFHGSSASALTKVVIPSTVEEISENAFYNAKSLTDLVITNDEQHPSKLAKIGKAAFYGLGASTVQLPSTLTEIGEQVFYFASLQTVTIPASVKTIGKNAFASNYYLKTVTFEKNSAVTTIADNAFNWCKLLNSVGTVKEVNNGETVTDEFVEGALPAGVESIGGSAFYNNKLTKIKIPASTKKIGLDAFGFTALESLEFETKAVEVEKTDASGTKTKVTEYKSAIAEIGNKAFRNTNISSVVIPESTAASIKLGTEIFQGCFELTSLTIPSGVQSGLEGALNTCVALENVIISADNPNYKSENGIIYNKSGDTLVYSYVPAAVDENGVLTVTAKNIGASAYAGQMGIKKVVFSKDIVTIGANAFEGCENLTEVEFSKESGSLTAIPDSAFEGCTSLAAVTNMPATVTSIGKKAFSGCKSLKSIEYGAGVTTLGNYAFENSGLTEITFPKQLTTLGQEVFKGSAAVTQVYSQETVNGKLVTVYKPVAISLPASLTSIGASAFKNVQISSLTLHEGITSIGNYAFSNCFSMKNCAKTVTVPATVTSLGTYAFSDNTCLQKVEFAGTEQVPANVNNIGNYAFKNSAITSISLPASVKTLGQNAFENCANLKTVEFAEGIKITEIKSAAFKGCTLLEGVAVPEGVKTIGANSFENCTSLETATLPSSLTYIGKAAFMNSAIYEIVIPEKVRFLSAANKASTSGYMTGGTARLDPSQNKIGSNSSGQFAFCKNLTKVTLPANLEEIGAHAFFATPNLTTITYTGYEGNGNALPEKMKQICGWAFAYSGLDSIKTTGNTKLNQYVFADSKFKEIDVSSCENTSELPKASFAYTVELTAVVLPERVTSIAESAFESSAIENFTMPTTVTQVERKAFYGSGLYSIDLSNVVAYNGRMNSGYGVLENCKNLAAVVLSNKIDYLPDYMFKGCESLTSVNIPDSITSIGTMCFNGTALRSVNISKNVDYLGDSALLTPSLMYADQDGVERVHITVDEGNGIYYVKDNQLYKRGDNGDVIVTFFAALDANKTLRVPDGVATIPAYAFDVYNGVKKVILPESVKCIERDAFNSCYDLETVEMPAVEEIESWAFKTCHKLNYIKMPGTLTDIGSQVFRDCSALAEGGLTVDMSEVKAETTDIGSLMFYYMSGLLVNGEQGVHGIKKLILPSDMKEIPSGMFENCANLEWVTYYTGETDAEGNKILAGADKGNGVYLPEGLTYIHYEAFSGCSKITYAEIPASVTDFGTDATSSYYKGIFGDCTALEEVKFLGDTITALPVNSFLNCSALTKVNIPAAVTKIGEAAFSGCSSLQTLALPAAVTEIPKNAFLNCAKLSGIDTSAITFFGQSAFKGSGITEAVINVNVVTKYVGSTSVAVGSTFADCAELTKVTFGPDVDELCSSMFSGCTKLTSITLPEKLMEIESSMFSGSGITSIVIPDSVTDIWANAFTNCVNLESVTLGSGVNTIVSAFIGCTSIKEVYIPKNVTKLNGATNFQGWGEDQTVKFELSEYQVSKVYGISWKAADCNAKFEYGVAPSAKQTV